MAASAWGTARACEPINTMRKGMRTPLPRRDEGRLVQGYGEPLPGPAIRPDRKGFEALVVFRHFDRGRGLKERRVHLAFLRKRRGLMMLSFFRALYIQRGMVIEDFPDLGFVQRR